MKIVFSVTIGVIVDFALLKINIQNFLKNVMISVNDVILMSEQEIYVFRKYPFYEGSYPVIISFDYQKVKEAFDNEKKEEGYGYYIKKIPLNTPLQFTSGKTIEHIEIDYDGEVREWNGEKLVVK